MSFGKGLEHGIANQRSHEGHYEVSLIFDIQCLQRPSLTHRTLRLLRVSQGSFVDSVDQDSIT